MLNEWSGKWERTLANGTRQICHVPHVAPEAWFHELYRPLGQSEIEEMERKIGQRLPDEFKAFLKISNGLNVFSDSLSIWADRKTYQRTGDDAIQPYSLVDLNAERPKNCPPTWIFFGSYRWNGARVVLDVSETETQIKCVLKRTVQVVKTWPSFSVWLLNEITRLKDLYDENGRKKDRMAPTSLDYTL